MADTNPTISIIAELVDKVSGPLADLQKKIVDFGGAAQNSTVVAGPADLAGTANVTTGLSNAAVAAAAMETAVASINAGNVAEVATAANSAAISLGEAEVAQAELNAEAADTTPLLEEVAAAAAQVRIETESAAQAMGDGANAAAGGVTSNTARARGGLFILHRQVLAVILAVKGIELGMNAVNAAIAAGQGNWHDFNTSMAAAETTIKGIPLVGQLILSTGEFINAQSIRLVNLYQRVVDTAAGIPPQQQKQLENAEQYNERLADEAKQQDGLVNSLKIKLELQREAAQRQSVIATAEAQVRALQKQQEGDIVGANAEQLNLKQSILETQIANDPLMQKQFGTALGITDAEAKRLVIALRMKELAQEQLDERRQAFDLTDKLSTAETTYADQVQRARELFAEGKIDAGEMDQKIADATDRLGASVNQANRAITEAKENHALQPGDEDQLRDKVAQNQEAARVALNQTNQDIANAVREAPLQPLQQFLLDVEHGTVSLKSAFATMLQGIADNLLQFVNSQAATAFLNFLMGPVDSKGNAQGGGLLGGLISGLTSVLGGAFGGGAATSASYFHVYADGGVVPGAGFGDTVPALLTPGETVITRQASQQFAPYLAAMNAGFFDEHVARAVFGPGVQRFAAGGVVQSVGASMAQHGAHGSAVPKFGISVIPPTYENAMNLLSGSPAAIDWIAQNSNLINQALGH